jgi:hypothetical protein
LLQGSLQKRRALCSTPLIIHDRVAPSGDVVPASKSVMPTSFRKKSVSHLGTTCSLDSSRDPQKAHVLATCN